MINCNTLASINVKKIMYLYRTFQTQDKLLHLRDPPTPNPLKTQKYNLHSHNG